MNLGSISFRGYDVAFVGLLVVSLALSILLYNPVPIILPIAVVGIMVVAFNLERFYNLFFLLLPFSIEYYLPGGVGMDLPSEPMMLILSFCSILMLAVRFTKRQVLALVHPIGIMMMVHILWIVFTSIYSSQPVYSLKFILAKLWYVLPFFVLPIVLLEDEKGFRRLFKFLLIGTMLSVVYVMVRHASMGFSFDSINQAVRPIYRNHVNYGILLIIALPYLMYLRMGSGRKLRWVYTLALFLLLLAIYLTYTRAAHLCVFIALISYYIIKWRLIIHSLLISAAAVILFSFYLSIDNQYLELAPDYNKAVAHKKFDNLVEATYKMEDISTVERFYRWIAGVNMVKERPWVGFGPASFYSEYRPYTVTSYKTYVSNNPEKSGIHNYYLMTAAEQGLPGLLIFIAMVVLMLLSGERVYHGLKDEQERALVMAAVVSLILILAVLLINDLIEADKVGPFFFLAAAIIAIYGTRLTSRAVKTTDTAQLKEREI